MGTILERSECDVLVVGAGIAGLVAAMQAAEHGMKTIVACKGKIAGGASYFPGKASLGIQVTKGTSDYELFKNDIGQVAQGMNDPKIVDAYLTDSPRKIGLLNKIGFRPWLRGDNRPACFARHPRDIFMISDWQEASRNARTIVGSSKHIVPFERSSLIRILTDHGRIVGAVIEHDGEYLLIRCKAIVLATGGLASLYQHNLYPNHLYGGGHAAALEAGCQLVNMEYIQFIPGLVAPKNKVLFGEHTLKYCTGMVDRQGNDLLADLSPPASEALFVERSAYAPFSCDYASQIFDIRMMEAIRAGSDGVRLTFGANLYEDRSEFYAIYLDWLKRERGIDMCVDEICVAPFAHSCNGGIRIDEHGETAVAGLFAVGEVSSAIEGANRLGGNSVGGALVFADRAIERVAQYRDLHESSVSFDEMENDFRSWCAQFAAIESTCTATEVLKTVRQLLWINANVLREHGPLSDALARFDELEAAYSPLVHGFDAYHALVVAKVLMLAMLGRTESRGAHFRADYPRADSRVYRQIVVRHAGALEIRRDYQYDPL
jgi:fumarate reductase (CoM/CoB) subunit A